MLFPRVPEWALVLFTEENSCYRESLVAIVGDEILAHAMYVRSDNGRDAEVAIIVEDGWQSKGVGKLLLSKLAKRVRRRGIEAFTGEVLGENQRVLGLFNAMFAGVEYGVKGGSYHVRAPLRALEPAKNLHRTSDHRRVA